MRFITIRDFRNKTAEIRKDIERGREIVLTINGRPFALLTGLDPDCIDEEVMALRRAKARIAINLMRAQAKKRGLNRMTMEEIDALIGEVRRKRSPVR